MKRLRNERSISTARRRGRRLAAAATVSVALLATAAVPAQARHRAPQAAAAHGAPRVVLTGGTWFGDVKILHQRRWEKFLRRG